MKRKCIVSIVVLMGLLFSFKSNAQMAKFEALYLYNICRYVEWPASSSSGEFVIGLVGNNAELEANLKAISKSKTIQGRPVVVKSINSPSQGSSCHIVFFSNSAEGQIASYMPVTRNALLASESDGAIEMGSDINFFLDGNKLKFDMSNTNLSKKNLRVSADLKQLAASVK